MITSNKVIDSLKDEPKRYEAIQHKENDLDCLHCKFVKGEQSLTDKINSMKNTDTTKQVLEDGKIITKTFKKLVVKRGKYDDVIGWFIHWS